jgi:hypothetical protein
LKLAPVQFLQKIFVRPHKPLKLKIPIQSKGRTTHVQPPSYSVQLLMPLPHANIAVFCVD